MKKLLWLVIVVAGMIFMLSSCQENEDTPMSKSEIQIFNKDNRNYSTFSEIIEAMDEDVNNAVSYLSSSVDELFVAVGDSYESYLENVDKVENWYVMSQSISKELYERINEKSIDYYKMIVKTLDLEDFDEWSKAIEDCYDAWNDAMDDYYDAWDDAYDDVYDKCDELIYEAYDTIDYRTASDAWSSMYSSYSNGWEEIYSLYSDAWSVLYSNYSAVWSGLFHGETDIDSMIEMAERERIEEEKQESDKETHAQLTPTPEPTPTPASADSIRPEFQAAMDSYEAFFDEYIAFMEKYEESDDSLSMLTDYVNYMSKFSDTMEKLDAIDEDELTDEELAYYMEVMLRISTKLMSVN